MLYGLNRNIIACSTSALTCVTGYKQFSRVPRILLLICICIAVVMTSSRAGSAPLPRVNGNQVIFEGVRVHDYLTKRNATGTMVVTKRHVKLKVVWEDGSQETFEFNYPPKKGINPANYAEMIQKALGSDVRLAPAEIEAAQQENSELTKAAITFDAIDQAKESSSGDQYYSATFQVTKTHEINSTTSTNANPVYKFAIDFGVETNGLSLDVTYGHRSKKDGYKELIDKKQDRISAPIKKITYNPGKLSFLRVPPDTNDRKACPACKLHESKFAGLKAEKGEYLRAINIFLAK